MENQRRVLGPRVDPAGTVAREGHCGGTEGCRLQTRPTAVLWAPTSKHLQMGPLRPIPPCSEPRPPSPGSQQQPHRGCSCSPLTHRSGPGSLAVIYRDRPPPPHTLINTSDTWLPARHPAVASIPLRTRPQGLAHVVPAFPILPPSVSLLQARGPPGSSSLQSPYPCCSLDPE